MAEAVLNAFDPEAQKSFQRALGALSEARVPVLVGGAYALRHYTGIERKTKDFDLFCRPHDVERVLEVLLVAGFRTELPVPHWLGKAFAGENMIDLIFNSGNGTATVDELWFEHAESVELFGLPVWVCPPEESIWSRAFIMERDRYDGADVAHMLLATAERLDWSRLLRRFGPYWRVLLSHLVLFGFIYPSERDRVPPWVMTELGDRLRDEVASPPPEDNVCQGTLLSWCQYLVDVQDRGMADARLRPRGTLTEDEVAHWTALDKD